MDVLYNTAARLQLGFSSAREQERARATGLQIRKNVASFCGELQLAQYLAVSTCKRSVYTIISVTGIATYIIARLYRTLIRALSNFYTNYDHSAVHIAAVHKLPCRNNGCTCVT